MKYRIISLLLCVMVITHAFPAKAAPNILVDSSDKSIHITGWLGEESALVGNLRLTAQRENIEKFVFLASDLRQKEGNEIINRHQVTVVGETKLSVGIPHDFQLKVTDVRLPGTYEGTLQVLLPNQTQPQAQNIPIQVIAKARPTLIPLGGTEQIQLHLVNCDGVLSFFDCLLAKALLPASAFLNQWQLQFDNPNQAYVTIIDAKVILRGEQTGYQLTETALNLSQGTVNLPGDGLRPAVGDRIITLPLNLNRSIIPPDRYTGTIYFTLSEQTQRLAIPVDLRMRSGPIIPLMVLIFGVILGRLLKYMQESGSDITRAIKAVYRLKARIRQEAGHSEDQDILNNMVEWVGQLIRWEKIDKALAEIDAIEARLEALNKLRQIENQILEMQQEDSLNKIAHEVHKNIIKTRSLLAQRNDAVAQRCMQEVMKGLANLNQKRQLDKYFLHNEAFSLLELADSVQRFLIQADAVSPIPSNQPEWKIRCQDFLILLSGVSDDIRIGATFWLVRPFLSLTLLVGLSLVGIGSLYVDNGLTFGARPFSDYLGLILWGISADVASRNLSNLQNKNLDNNTNLS
ncbi:coiled-coil domain-containing protein [Anabaena sp. FACHB-709]|nr:MULTISPECIES: hypothetical protein [Nostocaceae]HBW29028.1 hypothetical protein [Nostoc sp. UBA8866]MBD2174306.1 hypothetical protein [Anabaena cylindrica FACHB-318]MBD2266024.1 hypothetical protein [Anabaena sp. FACHB-709]MBD2275398.1 hypothetical protein [Nostoc sp. PCC 7120 = FACHB-418]MBD2286435.1 hypothetical protein [Anabaena cylindrica FACHB-170]